jgi:transposase
MLATEVAMGRIVGPAWTVTAEQRAEVEALLRRTDLAPRVRERLEMVKGRALGQDVEQVATWSGRSVRRVRHWAGRFRDGGAAALADAPRAGRPVKADGAYLQALEAAVETPPPSLGLPFDVWTPARLSAYPAGTTGVRIAPGWLRALLARRDFVCGRPKHTLKHLQDRDEVAACQAALAEAGGKGGGRAGPLRVPLSG